MRRGVKLLLAGLAAFGLYKLTSGGRRRNEQRPASPRPERDLSQERWDEVDEASYESFPASDPPAYSRGKR